MTLAPDDRTLTIQTATGPVTIPYVPPAADDPAVFFPDGHGGAIAQKYSAPSVGEPYIGLWMPSGIPLALALHGGLAPVAAFHAVPLTGGCPCVVAFTDDSANYPASWSWVFGDGGTATAQSPTHIYTAPGTYTVTLTATNSAGSDSLTKTAYIVITTLPAFVYTESIDYYKVDGYNIPYLPWWTGTMEPAGTAGYLLTGWMIDATGPWVDLAVSTKTAAGTFCQKVDFDYVEVGAKYYDYMGGSGWVEIHGSAVSDGGTLRAVVANPANGSHNQLDLGEPCYGVAVYAYSILHNSPHGVHVSMGLSGIMFT